MTSVLAFKFIEIATMETKAENIIVFPTDLQLGIYSVVDNISTASENLKRSASILQLKSTQSGNIQSDSISINEALHKAQELTKNARSLNEQINLLRSNLLK
jgi:hypothetical protein